MSASTAVAWCWSLESTLYYKHGLDYVFQNRLTVSNHSTASLKEEYSPYVWTGGSGTLTRTHMLRDRPSWGLLHGADGGTAGHEKKQRCVCGWGGGGARKKEKCLLNDITIVSWSRTMALCKTANNERGRNPLSYRGLAACSPLP